MSRAPSDFLKFLRERAETKDGKLHLKVEIPPKELDRLIEDAEFYEQEPNVSDTLVQIRTEAKQALANLKDKRDALQVISASIDKELQS